MVDTAEIKRRLKANNPTITTSSKYVNWKTRMRFHCKVCGRDWDACPQGPSSGVIGCRDCGYKRVAAAHKNRRKPQLGMRQVWRERMSQHLQKFPHVHWLNAKQPPTQAKDLCKFSCDTCKHRWEITAGFFMGSKYGCPKCGIKMRGHARILTQSAASKYICETSKGNTRLVSEWSGEGKPRTYQCVQCRKTWVAKGRGMLDVNCPHQCSAIWGVSKVAQRWLVGIAREKDIYIQHAGNGGEFSITGTRYHADGYHAPSKTVYEFYGDIYHGNLKRYAPDAVPNHWTKLTTIQLYRRTMRRERRIRRLGYRVVSIWESDYAAQCKRGRAS